MVKSIQKKKICTFRLCERSLHMFYFSMFFLLFTAPALAKFGLISQLAHRQGRESQVILNYMMMQE